MVGQQSEVQSQWTQGMGDSLGHIHKDISSEATGLVESSVSSSCAEQGLTHWSERGRLMSGQQVTFMETSLARLRDGGSQLKQRHALLPRTWASKHGFQAQGRESCQKVRSYLRKTSTLEESSKLNKKKD